jgi:hypothetical protein
MAQKRAAGDGVDEVRIAERSRSDARVLEDPSEVDASTVEMLAAGVGNTPSGATSTSAVDAGRLRLGEDGASAFTGEGADSLGSLNEELRTSPSSRGRFTRVAGGIVEEGEAVAGRTR